MGDQEKLSQLRENSQKLLDQLKQTEKDLLEVSKNIEAKMDAIMKETSASKGKSLIEELHKLEQKENEVFKSYTTEKQSLFKTQSELRIQLCAVQEKIWEQKPDKDQMEKLVGFRNEITDTLTATLVKSGVEAKGIRDSSLVLDGTPTTEVEGSIHSVHKWEINSDELEIYETQPIGSGTFGEVYKGKYLESEVAVKKLYSQNVDQQQMDDFIKEIRIMASLRHPNLLLLMGACTTPGKLCVVTELMAKGSVASLLDRLPFRRKMMIAKATAQGMNWLHHLPPPNGPILHLDLKPANLLLDHNYNVKIADFGMSVMKQHHKGHIGSPLYMAPEMLEGKDYDQKADVYSFGICLWELFYSPKKKPYDGKYKGFDELKAAVLKGVRPSIERAPPILKKLLTSCFNPDPKQRPTFKTMLVQSSFDNIILEGLIREENSEARNFWEKEFFGRWVVTWKEFCAGLQKSWNVPSQKPENEVRYNILQVLLHAQKDPTTKDALVSIEAFSSLLDWVGPVKDGAELMDVCYKLASKPWFHGSISKQEAEHLMAKSDIKSGTFLVRFSESTPGSYTITAKAKTKSSKQPIQHYRISHLPGEAFVIGNVEFSSLEDIVQNHRKKLGKVLTLSTACPGSSLHTMFLAAKGTTGPGAYLYEADFS